MSKNNIAYKWVAFCKDSDCPAENNASWSQESRETFDDKGVAYLDMRGHALVKTEWNTEPEDFDDTDAIRYEIWFSPEIIVHASYSGVYVYRIVPADARFTAEEFFSDKKVADFLSSHGL